MQPYDGKEIMGRRALLVTSKNHYKLAAFIIPQGSDVLDVGAGYRDLEPYLVGCTYKAIDATKWICDISHAENIDVMDYTPNKKFDYVCAFGVLETCTDLQEMANKLKSLCSIGLLSSYTKTTTIPFISYTKEQIENAFGECTFYPDKNDPNTEYFYVG